MWHAGRLVDNFSDATYSFTLARYLLQRHSLACSNFVFENTSSSTGEIQVRNVRDANPVLPKTAAAEGPSILGSAGPTGRPTVSRIIDAHKVIYLHSRARDRVRRRVYEILDHCIQAGARKHALVYTSYTMPGVSGV